MHGIYKIHIRIFFCQCLYGLTHRNKSITEILATMTCDQHQFLPICQTIHIITCLIQCFLQLCIQCFVTFDFVHYHIESINHSITCHCNCFLFHPFSQKILTAQRRRRKMISSNTPGDKPVHLLRPRTINIVGAQTRFHMPHWYLLIEGR